MTPINKNITFKHSMTITEKRALLWKYYLLVRHLNNEEGYYRTLIIGIPDNSIENVYDEIIHGDYDIELNELIQYYDAIITSYSPDGYYVHGIGKTYCKQKVLHALEEAGLEIPDKIRKVRY